MYIPFSQIEIWEGAGITRPLLLLNVTKDQLVPRFFADSLHNASGPNTTELWLDTDHIFSTVDRQDLGRTVIRFVQDNLPK